MDVWENLVANSTLAEGDGDAWEHLINPSGEGGGGITIIKIKSFKVAITKVNYRIMVDSSIHKITIPKITYKIVYKPETLAVAIKPTNVIITKGC